MTATPRLIGTGSASYCDPTAKKAFARWDDSAYHAHLYNGGFESGSLGWTLSGGAKVVAGDEPFFLSGDGRNNRSLLPSLVGGLLAVLDGGTVTGSGTWAPSPRPALALSNVTSLLGTRYGCLPVHAGGRRRRPPARRRLPGPVEGNLGAPFGRRP